VYSITVTCLSHIQRVCQGCMQIQVPDTVRASGTSYSLHDGQLASIALSSLFAWRCSSTTIGLCTGWPDSSSASTSCHVCTCTRSPTQHARQHSV
jgi:hypothetical protein